MNRRDLPPGQRLMVLGGEVAEGDVLSEWGPRIGQRYWGVVFVEKAKRYWHAAVRPLQLDEVKLAAGDGAMLWGLRR